MVTITTTSRIWSFTFLILKNSFSNRIRKVLVVIADYKILGQKISYLKELPYVVYLMHKIDLLQFFFFFFDAKISLSCEMEGKEAIVITG